MRVMGYVEQTDVHMVRPEPGRGRGGKGARVLLVWLMPARHTTVGTQPAVVCCSLQLLPASLPFLIGPRPRCSRRRC